MGPARPEEASRLRMGHDVAARAAEMARQLAAMADAADRGELDCSALERARLDGAVTALRELVDKAEEDRD